MSRNRWWSKLSQEQRDILTDIVKNDFMPFQRAVNFCNDKRTLDRFVTTDKSAPGVYVMSAEEAAAIKEAEGGATDTWIKTKVDDRGDALVDQFSMEAAALVEANPPGSSALEQTDWLAVRGVLRALRQGGGSLPGEEPEVDLLLPGRRAGGRGRAADGLARGRHPGDPSRRPAARSRGRSVRRAGL